MRTQPMRKTIAVSGGFDPVHIGHIRMIKEATKYGDVIVFLNSDAFLMRKKSYVFMDFAQRKEILENINNTVSGLIHNIYNAKLNMNYISKSVSILDNNYFVEDKYKIYFKIQNILDSDELERLNSLLLSYKYIVENNINNICEHEWIDDDVDMNIDVSKRITYCNICQISKKC
jgi:cytidyltransferase-like protein